MRKNILFPKRWSAHSSPNLSIRPHWPLPIRILLVLAMGVIAYSAYRLGSTSFSQGFSLTHLIDNNQTLITQQKNEIEALIAEREQLKSLTNTADATIKTERAIQEKYAEQVKALESENNLLKEDLAFYETLLPVNNNSANIAVRAFRVDTSITGLLRYRFLVIQRKKDSSLFRGRFGIVVQGSLQDKLWKQDFPQNINDKDFALNVEQSRRVQNELQLPNDVKLNMATIRLFNSSGHLIDSYSVKL